MKKILILILSVLTVFAAAMTVVSCGKPSDPAQPDNPGEPEIKAPMIMTTEATFIKELPSDITIEYALNGNEFKSLATAGADVATNNYTQSDKAVVLKQEYLLTLAQAEYKFEIRTSNGNLEFVLTVRDLSDPDSLEDILNDPYYDVNFGEGNGLDSFPENPDPESSYGKYLRIKKANERIKVGETINVTFKEAYWDMRLRPYAAVYDRPAEDAGAYFTYLPEGGIRVKTNGVESGIFDYLELRGAKLTAGEEYEMTVKYKTASGSFCMAFNGNGFMYMGNKEVSTVSGKFVAQNPNGMGNDILNYIQMMCNAVTPNETPEIEIYELSLTRIETLATGISAVDKENGIKSVLWSDRAEDAVIDLNVRIAGNPSLKGFVLKQDGSATNGIEVNGAQIKIAKSVPVGVYKFTATTESSNKLAAVYTVEVADASSTNVPSGITATRNGAENSLPVGTAEAAVFNVVVSGNPKMPGFTVTVKDSAQKDVTNKFVITYGKYFNEDVLTIGTNNKSPLGDFTVTVSTWEENGAGSIKSADATFHVHGAEPETEVPENNKRENLREEGGKFVENFADGKASVLLGNILLDFKGHVELINNGNAIAGTSMQIKYPLNYPVIFLGQLNSFLPTGFNYTIEMDVRFISGEPSSAFFFGMRNNNDGNQFNKQIDMTGMKVGEVRHLSASWNLTPVNKDGGDFYGYMFFYDNPAKNGVIAIDNFTVINNGAVTTPETTVPENNSFENLKTTGGSYIENFAAGEKSPLLGNLTLDFPNNCAIASDVTAVAGNSFKVTYPMPQAMFFGNTKGFILKDRNYAMEMDIRFVSGEPSGALFFGFQNDNVNNQFNLQFDLSGMKPGELKHLRASWDIVPKNAEGGDFYAYMFFYDNPAKNGTIIIDNVKITNNGELWAKEHVPETTVPEGNALANISAAGGSYIENFGAGDKSALLGNILLDYKEITLANDNTAIAGTSLKISYPIAYGTIFLAANRGMILPGYNYTMEMDVRFISGEPSSAFFFGFQNDNVYNQFNTQCNLSGMLPGQVKHFKASWDISPQFEEGGTFYSYMFFYDNPAKEGVILLDNIKITNNGKIGSGNSAANLKEAGGTYTEDFADGQASGFLGNMLNDYAGKISLENAAEKAVADYSLNVIAPFPAGSLPLFFSCVKGNINENTKYRIEMDIKLVSGTGNSLFYAGFRNNDDSKQFNAAQNLSTMKVGDVQHFTFDINVGTMGEIGGDFYMYMFFMGGESGVIAMDNIKITNMAA